jgi:predicted kinase
MKIIIMQGLPGSGKSTYAAQNYPEAKVCSADNYFMFGGEYKFDPSLLEKAFQACMRQFLWLTKHEEPTIVVDNTNLSLWEMAPYIQVGAALGYEVEVIRANADLETCISRNVHGVPRETILRMAERMEKPLPFWACSFREV